MGREVPAAIHSNRSAIAGQTADTVLGLAPLDDNRGDCNKKRKRKIMSGATATAQCPSRGAAHVASPSVRSDPDPSAGGGAAPQQGNRPRTMSESIASGNVSVGDMVAKAKKAAVSLWLILHAQVRHHGRPSLHWLGLGFGMGTLSGKEKCDFRVMPRRTLHVTPMHRHAL